MMIAVVLLDSSAGSHWLRVERRARDHLATVWCLLLAPGSSVVIGFDSTDQAPRPHRFATLLASCQRPVFLYAMSLLHSEADAEEVLQQTNLVLWQKFDEYDPGMDFVKWACGIARYEVLKFRERQPREKRLLSDRFLNMLAAKSEAAVGLLDARRRALQSCLQKLADSDRRLILSRYQPSATTVTVAESLGRSVQGTRKAMRRIRGALLACVLRTLTTEGDA